MSELFFQGRKLLLGSVSLQYLEKRTILTPHRDYAKTARADVAELTRKKYVLTKRLKTMLERKGDKLICAAPNCGKPLEPNDIAVSTRGYKSRRSSYYHVECYEKLFQ